MKKSILSLIALVYLCNLNMLAQSTNTMSNPIVIGGATGESGPFTYSDTQNTNNANFNNTYNSLCGNVVYYKLVLTTRMNIKVNHCGSDTSFHTYVYLLDQNGSELDNVFIDYYSTCDLDATLEETLDPGTYYILSSSTDVTKNGNITTNVTGTFAGDSPSDPIELGSNQLNFTYTDTQNTTLFTKDGYHYIDNDDGLRDSVITNDIYYQFEITYPMVVEISNCGSQLGDTYLDVEDGNETVMFSDDNYTGVGQCSNTNQAYLKTALEPGTYLVRTLGKTQDGLITTTIKGTLLPEGYDMQHPINVGIKYDKFQYSDTQNTEYFLTNAYQRANDVVYEFTIAQSMNVTISHCGSEVSDTYMELHDSFGTIITSNNYLTSTSQCQNPFQQTLAAGTYYVISEGYSGDGNITTSIQGTLLSGASAVVPIRNCNVSITPTIATQNASTLTAAQSIQVSSYLDGFGSPTQTVLSGVSGDLVSLSETDANSMSVRNWLPLLAPNNGGKYVVDFQTTAMAATTGESRPFLETVYQTGRPGIQYKPGQVFQNSGKATQYKYLMNDPNDPVLTANSYSIIKRLNPPTKDLCTNAYSISNALDYNYNDPSVRDLYVTRTTNEDNQVSLEFKNKWGQLVLQRTVGEDGNHDTNDGNHDTNYIYDDLGNLYCVLPPMASDLFSGSLNYNNDYFESTDLATLDQYAYQYRYDDRGRCIAKKLPGARWSYMVYDAADRLILSQDGNQRIKNECSFAKYDILGRVIQTGTLSQVTDSLQVSGGAYKGIVVTETMNGTDYTNLSIPNVNTQVLTTNYYDNYNYTGAKTYTAENTYGTKSSYPSKGLLTGSKVSMLDTPTKQLVTTIYYDDNARPVQVLSDNHLAGYDNAYYTYNFIGQPTMKRHKHLTSGLAAEIAENYVYAYDNMGRPTTTSHCLNANAPVVISSLTYDAYGHITQKVLHGGQQTLSYTYNLQNQLKTIASAEFNETLYYYDATTGATPTYNGNISSLTWKNKPTAADQTYAFTYDKLNRLTAAHYSPGETFTETIDQYDKNGNIVKLTRNGKAWDATLMYASVVIPVDGLTFGYNGNQLTSTTDAEVGYNNRYMFSENNDFKQGSNPNNLTAYIYDANGNLSSDLNKKIAWTRYNYLNLPQKVQFQNGNTSEYLYDASGVKQSAIYRTGTASIQIPLGQTTTENTSFTTAVTTTDYCTNFIYQNGILNKILLPDGFITTNSTTDMTKWQYVYFLKDHLGNNRIAFQVSTTNGVTSYTVKNTTDFYPFGMEFRYQASSNFNAYLYGGKEIDRMQGLMEYDFGARWYDPIIGRWGTLDPMAENNYSNTPYKYSNNNPENYIDPDGREERTDMWGNVIALLNDVPYGTDYAKSIYIDPNGNIEGVTNILPEVTVTAPYVMNDPNNQSTQNRAGYYNNLYNSSQGGVGSNWNTSGNIGTAAGVISTDINLVNKTAQIVDELGPVAKGLTIAGHVGTFLGAASAAYSGYKVYNQIETGQKVNGLDATDAVVGTVGTIASGVATVATILGAATPVGWVVVGGVATVYGVVRLGMFIYNGE